MDAKIKSEIADKIWDSLKVEEYGLDDDTAKHAIRMAIDAAVSECEKRSPATTVSQRQDSLKDQLIEVQKMANRIGCYDAADFLLTFLTVGETEKRNER